MESCSKHEVPALMCCSKLNVSSMKCCSKLDVSSMKCCSKLNVSSMKCCSKLDVSSMKCCSKLNISSMKFCSKLDVGSVASCSKLRSKLWWYRHPKQGEFTTTWLPVSSKVFLIFRWLMAFLSLVALTYSIINRILRYENNPDKFLKYPIYLTNWNRILAVISLLLDASLSTLWYSTQEDSRKSFMRTRNLPLIYRFLWCMYTIVTPISILVTVVYWSLMYNPAIHTLSFDNFFAHLIVTVIALLDLFVSRKPWCIAHFYQPIVFCVFWCIFSAIYWSLGGTSYHGEPYIYKILNWGGNPKIFVSVMIGIAIFLILTHLVIAGVVRLRNWMEKKWGDRLLEDDPEENVEIIL